MPNFIDKVGELRKSGTSVRHLGRRYVEKVEQWTGAYLSGTKVLGESGYLEFYQDPQTRAVLVVDFTRDDRTGRKTALRYAVLGSNLKVLPDADYCGEVHGTEHKLNLFLQNIRNGLRQI